MKTLEAKQLMRSRDGFTLIELIVAILIVGLLMAIVVSRMWVVKDRSYWAAVKSDLRTAALLQEKYFNDHQQYANDVADLPEMALTEGVAITVTWTANNGWAGTGTHSSFTSGQCGFFTGPAPAGAATPATVQGKIVCDE